MDLTANYHTHTWRCNHADGTEEDYVQAAMEAGMRTLGFSDHTPYCFPGDYCSRFRMRRELLPDYAQTIRDLQKAYAGKIDLHLGVECEYYPKFFDETLALLRDNGVEYLLLGQHFLGNEMDGTYSGLPADADALKRYCHQCMDAMNTGLFTYFAHPDLIHYVGDERIYLEQMRELCREAKRCGMALEINMEGMRSGRWYPGKLFLEAAGEESCPMIIGCDAHTANALKEKDAQARAYEMAKEHGLTVLETVELRQI